MKKDVFAPANILLPKGISMETWSVIACDQFSSDRDYWERVTGSTAGAPSTYGMMIPEAYLADMDESEQIEKISETMEDYLQRELFIELKDSFVYVERTLPDGRVRRGLVGSIDLEEYDFSGGGNTSAIRASEGTVLDRLPVRIRVRRAVKLETPHIIVFINDADKTVIELLAEKADDLPLLYDFDLMEGGGHIKGIHVFGDETIAVKDRLKELHKNDSPLMVVGDGNHSLAAAKAYWDELKSGLDEAEIETHPARRALVEVNNVYDPAVSFEAIHRVVFDTDPEELAALIEQALKKGKDYELRLVSAHKEKTIGISAVCFGDLLTTLQELLDGYISSTGCRIDYIHDEESAYRLVQGDSCLGLILPAMDKSELFATVAAGALFPKKSFSVGRARDKRYYLECRGLRNDVAAGK